MTSLAALQETSAPAATGPRMQRAVDADLPEIRAFLAERPLAGAVRLAFVPGPDARAGSSDERRHLLVLRDGASGRVVGTGARVVRRVWLGGRTVRVGFLTRLRLAPGACTRGRLAAGYDWIEATRRPDETSFDLTTIVSDNQPARRLLERGVRGLPEYTQVAALETLVCATSARGARAGRGARPASRDDAAAIAAFLGAVHGGRPFAPAWTAADFAPDCVAPSGHGPAASDFVVVEDARGIVAVGAVRDLRREESLVVTGYAPWLGALRPVVNVGRAVVGRPRLPTPGAELAVGHVSSFAVRGDDPDVAATLLGALRARARERGLDLLAITLAEKHPLLPSLRARAKARSYVSTLYAVSRCGGVPQVSSPPEIEASWL